MSVNFILNAMLKPIIEAKLKSGEIDQDADFEVVADMICDEEEDAACLAIQKKYSWMEVKAAIAQVVIAYYMGG